MLYRKPSVLRALPALLVIALVAACSRAPAPEPKPAKDNSASNTEIVVIAKDDAPQVVQPEWLETYEPTGDLVPPEQLPERGVTFPQDSQGEDPTDSPNNDLAENPNAWGSALESPIPNGSGSAVGLSGGYGGGGGRGGRGGFAFRRARGGGAAAPTIDPVKEGLRWLADHQNKDGFWSFKDFASDTTRKGAKQTHNIDATQPDDAGGESDEIQATGLALWAFAAHGYDHKTGDFRGTTRAALLYLRKTQDNNGCLGDSAHPDIIQHAIATIALADSYGISGDQVLKPMCDKAVDYLLNTQLKGSGWGTGDANLVETAWAVLALKEAKVAGVVFDSSAAMSGAGAFLDQLIYADKSGARHAMYSVQNIEAPRDSALPTDQLNAAWVATALLSNHKQLSDGEITDLVSIIRTPDLTKDGDAYDYWYWGTHAMYQVGGQPWKDWCAAIEKPLAERQRGFNATEKGKADAKTLDEYGSWDEVGGNGRVHATATALLIDEVFRRYQRLAPSTGPDTGKDGLADLPDMDGFARAQTASRRAHCGTLMARDGVKSIGEFPLRHTGVRAKVSGTLAGTTVTQTFSNPYDRPIEAMYTFPLPGDSAINDFTMQIGGRRIIGVIRSREEAVKVYRAAKARGYTASLLTQNRPNVFTQSVANIETGGEVKVEITYYQRLKYQDCRFEYVFPMTLTPRFKPAANGSHEIAPDEDEDEDELDNPEDFDVHALPPGMRSGMDIDLTVEIDAGMPIDVARTRSLAHEVLLDMTNEGRAVVRLCKRDAIPNRDFVLRWGIAGDAPEVGLLTHTDKRGSFLSLQVQPQLDPADADITPREITFILDNSGSMSGAPSQMSKQIIRKTLDNMQPDDKFNLVYFAGSNAQLFDTPKDNTPENVSSAKTFLGNTNAGGGTMMLPALQRALTMKHDPRHIQIFAFLTDGAVRNEAEILKTIKGEGKDARFFSFGVGSSVNRYLIDGIAEQGHGKAIYALPRDGQYDDSAVEEFFSAIDRPVLCDIDIDWNGLSVDQCYPTKLNDLFASQPLQLQARYSGSGKHTVYIRGRVGARHVEYPVELDLDAKADNPAIAAIWARSRIAELEKRLLTDANDPVLTQGVLETALEFNLMSSQTSFVAVDESRVASDGQPMRVWQPTEMPEGVTFAGDQLPAAESKAYHIEGWGLWVGQTADGRVIVVKVEDGGAAADAGMLPGQILESVNGIKVANLNSLENVLLQAIAKVEVETSLTDHGQRIAAKFKLPKVGEKK